MSYFDTPLVGIQHVPPNPRACLIVLHGLAEHHGRYIPTIESVAAAGIACFAYDCRGHGRSPGARGDIERFSSFAEDFRAICAGVARAHPGLPLFVYGHSLGSIVAIQVALDRANRLAGVIVTGTAVRAVPDWPPALWKIARHAAGVAPWLRVPLPLKAEALTHDLKIRQEYLNDPLILKKATVRLLTELGLACDDSLRRAPEIQVPWLAIHGELDTIAPVRGAQIFIDRLGAADKQLHIYPGLLHEVQNEAEPSLSHFRHQVIEWMRERTPT